MIKIDKKYLTDLEDDLLKKIEKLKLSSFIEKTKKAGIHTKNLQSWYEYYLQDLFTVCSSEDLESLKNGSKKEKIENLYITKEIEYMMEYIREWDKYDASIYDYYIDYLEGIKE